MVKREQGSIRYHRGGWELRVQHDGQRITRRHPGPDSRAGRRSAEEALERLAAQVGAGTHAMLVADLLARYQLAQAPEWSPSTVLAHRTHVTPVLAAYGATEVARLTDGDIEAVNATWLAEGLSAATVRRRHSILSAALIQAERWGIVAVSPARRVKLPTIRRTPVELADMTVVLAAIARIDHQRLRCAAHLAVATGRRRGELLALRWRDVDLDTGTIRITAAVARGEGRVLVRKATKTGSVSVLAVDPATVAEVRAWKAVAAEESMRAGHGRPSVSAPVLPSPTDPTAPWHPEHLTRRWVATRDRIDLAGMRFHDLRHLHATHLLAAGVSPATVAARMGWSSTKMALDVYGHAVPAGDRAAAEVIGRASGAG